MAQIIPIPNESHRKQSSRWRLLRTKAGVADDPDWAGDVSTVATIPPEDRGVASLFWEAPRGVSTQVEFYVVSFDAGNAALDRGTCTFDAALIEIANPPAGSAAVLTDELASEHPPLTSSALNTKLRLPANGLDAFTIRISTIATAPAGHDHFEIYYREVFE